jgi:hypothetical protein
MGGFEVAAEADGLVGFDECAQKSFDGGNQSSGQGRWCACRSGSSGKVWRRRTDRGNCGCTRDGRYLNG